MFPQRCFHVNVLAALGNKGTPLYTLVVETGSVLGLLYWLSRSLSATRNDGTIDRQVLAVDLIEMVRPMGHLVEYRVGAVETEDVDATVRVSVKDTTPPAATGDVPEIAVSLSRRFFTPFKRGEQLLDRCQWAPLEAEVLERAAICEAIDEECGILADIGDFVGMDRDLFKLLEPYIARPAPLAKWLLFTSTASRAESAVEEMFLSRPDENGAVGILDKLHELYETEKELHLETFRLKRRTNLQ